jgi:hypothetical protein
MTPPTRPPDAPPPAPPPLSWRAHAIALFVTFHIVCVFLYALPSPPGLSEQILDHPEVKAELDHSFGVLHRLVPWRDSPEAMRDDVFRVVLAYDRALGRVRGRIDPYLETVGSTLSWHMFGGTPPRFPLVFVVEVWPEGGDDFVLFQDLHWGTADSRALNFRHRKVQELLSTDDGTADWSAYAAYWARRWDERHPDRPARRVRLSFLRLRTPLPGTVRSGDNDRRPEPVPDPFLWERP